MIASLLFSFQGVRAGSPQWASKGAGPTARPNGATVRVHSNGRSARTGSLRRVERTVAVLARRVLPEVPVGLAPEDVLGVPERLHERNRLQSERLRPRQDSPELVLGERIGRDGLRTGFPADLVLDLPQDGIVPDGRDMLEDLLDGRMRHLDRVEIQMEDEPRLRPGRNRTGGGKQTEQESHGAVHRDVQYFSSLRKKSGGTPATSNP